MIQITPQMRILLAVEPVDFRNGIDGLAGVCRRVLEDDPFSGTLFVFCNRRRTALKILTYDGQGFWLFQKRLSEGKFRWWPRGSETALNVLAVHELQLLLWNGDPRGARTAPAWRRLAAG
jgi:transposase